MNDPIEPRHVRDVLAAFGSATADVKLLRRTNNEVYSVDADGRRYALRLHRGYRTPSHTRAELRLLEAIAPALEAGSVDVPRPVRSSSGDLVVVRDTDGATHASLLTWVPGAAPRRGQGLGTVGARCLGEALAHLHVVATAAARDMELALPSWNARTMFTDVSPFDTGPLDLAIPSRHRELFDAGVHLATDALEDLADFRHGTGVIHFDFILLNCRLRRGVRSRAGVIDFDDVGRGCYLYDLAPLVDNLLDFPGGRRLARAFCAGYDAVAPLPAGWPRLLTALMGGRQIVSALWAAAMGRRSGDEERAEQLIDIRIEQLRRYVEPRSAASVTAALSP